ncbi:MAG: hypothetical protein ACTSR2_06395, partial [Candidatus Hodarchaeales archaeon]
MSLEKKVVIRLIAETEVEKTKSAIAIFKRATNMTRHLDRSIYSLGRAYKQMKKAQAHANEMGKKFNATSVRLAKSKAAEKTKIKTLTKALKDYTKAVNAAKAAQDRFRSQRKKTLVFGAGVVTAKAGMFALSKFKQALGVAITYTKRLGFVLTGMTAVGAYAFANLSNEIAKINIVMDDNFDSSEAFFSSFIKMSQQSIFSAQELANVAFEIGAAMGDISSEQVRGMTETSQILAIASGFDDANVAANLLMTTFRQ